MKMNFTKKLIFIKLSALSLLFQGCGKDANTKKNSNVQHTALGTATAISFSSRENSDMNELDMEVLNSRLSLVLKNHIQTINNKESTQFSKQTNSCTLSGLINTENYGEIESHTKVISFELCQDDEIIQNGDIEVSYFNANENGKFPELLNIVVQKPYFFNDLNLTKDTEIEVFNIVYADSRIVSFDTFVTGQLIIDKHKVFNLQNFEQRIIL
jgi:hypothetical protein